MRDPATFRKYAEECRRLAGSMPDHRVTLLRMAEAWTTCAHDAERRREQGGGAPGEETDADEKPSINWARAPPPFASSAGCARTLRRADARAEKCRVRIVSWFAFVKSFPPDQTRRGAAGRRVFRSEFR
jgi:hypothetical protein